MKRFADFDDIKEQFKTTLIVKAALLRRYLDKETPIKDMYGDAVNEAIELSTAALMLKTYCDIETQSEQFKVFADKGYENIVDEAITHIVGECFTSHDID